MTHHFLPPGLISALCQMMSHISSKCCWNISALKGCNLQQHQALRSIRVHYEGLCTMPQTTLTPSSSYVAISRFHLWVCQSKLSGPCFPANSNLSKQSQTDCHAHTIMIRHCFTECPININTLSEYTSYWFFTVWRHPGLPSRLLRT